MILELNAREREPDDSEIVNNVRESVKYWEKALIEKISCMTKKINLAIPIAGKSKDLKSVDLIHKAFLDLDKALC